MLKPGRPFSLNHLQLPKLEKQKAEIEEERKNLKHYQKKELNEISKKVKILNQQIRTCKKNSI